MLLIDSELELLELDSEAALALESISTWDSSLLKGSSSVWGSSSAESSSQVVNLNPFFLA